MMTVKAVRILHPPLRKKQALSRLRCGRLRGKGPEEGKRVPLKQTNATGRGDACVGPAFAERISLLHFFLPSL